MGHGFKITPCPTFGTDPFYLERKIRKIRKIRKRKNEEKSSKKRNKHKEGSGVLSARNAARGAALKQQKNNGKKKKKKKHVFVKKLGKK